MRIYRIGKLNPDLKLGFQKVENDQRSTFYKENCDLVGPDLKKAMSECITTSTVKRQSLKFSAKGSMRPVEEVKEDMLKKGKKEEWDNLELNGNYMTCPITGARLIWEPTYSLEKTTEETETEEKKRKFEGTTNIKNPKAVKAPKLPAAPTDNAELPVVPLAPGQISRLEKLLPKIEELGHKLATNHLSCSDPKLKDYVTTSVMNKSADLIPQMTQLTESIKDLTLKKVARKGEITTFFAQVSQGQKDAKSFNEKLESFLDEASQGTAGDEAFGES